MFWRPDSSSAQLVGPPFSCWEFEDADKAKDFLKEHKTYPIVLKADGLALGKGVLICQNEQEALAGV
ncbi:MAG: hypothetical protein IIZ97_09910, partial [Prevotella sp.]|nr:hypothetical protein [Prevotella sp.]